LGKKRPVRRRGDTQTRPRRAVMDVHLAGERNPSVTSGKRDNLMHALPERTVPGLIDFTRGSLILPRRFGSFPRNSVGQASHRTPCIAALVSSSGKPGGFSPSRSLPYLSLSRILAEACRSGPKAQHAPSKHRRPTGDAPQESARRSDL